MSRWLERTSNATILATECEPGRQRGLPPSALLLHSRLQSQQQNPAVRTYVHNAGFRTLCLLHVQNSAQAAAFARLARISACVGC